MYVPLRKEPPPPPTLPAAAEPRVAELHQPEKQRPGTLFGCTQEGS